MGSVERARIIRLGLAAVLLTAAPPLFAQPKADDKKAESVDAMTEQARRHFKNGVKLYNDGNFAGALAEFEAAYRLKPGPSSLKNVALSQKALFRYAEAADTLEQVLSRHKAELGEGEEKAIRGAIDELASLVGSVRIKTNVDEAKVSVDGRVLDKAALARPLRLNVGEHTLVAEAPGYGRVSRVLRVAGGQKDVVEEVTLTATAGFVSVTAQNPDDAVAVDGKPLRFGSWRGPLTPGWHYVQVYREGQKPFEKRVSVELGRTTTVEAPALEPADPGDEPEKPATPGTPSGPRQLRGWYALGSVSGLGLRNDPQDISIDSSKASGGSFGVRAGYRLWTPVAVELLLEGGRHDITGACDQRVEKAANRKCGTDAQLDRSLTLESIRLGPNLRIMSGGETIRFTSTLGVGAVRHQLELDAVSDSDVDRSSAVPGGKAKGWDPYFLLEVGIQYNWGHVLLELDGLTFIDGASNVKGSDDLGDSWAPYSDTGGLFMAGIGLRAGWSEWTPDAAPKR